jgi:deoxyribodipyrimidine photo-lyase
MDVPSGLSPHLHFGHLSFHKMFSELATREKWKPKLAVRAKGSREGWWNLIPAAEGFLDELITWREVGYNFPSHRKDYDQYESLPEWARKTLREHTKDEREWVYSLEEFEAARTHDSLWNAAQTQLVREGRMHNYLRMLWGKKILEWSRTPQEAAGIMFQLNNKYTMDGKIPIHIAEFLGVRKIRPVVGPGTADFRKDPVHGFAEYGAEGFGEGAHTQV